MGASLRLDMNWLDYSLLAVYFAVVLGIGFAAKRSVNSSWTSSCPGGPCPPG